MSIVQRNVMSSAKYEACVKRIVPAHVGLNPLPVERCYVCISLSKPHFKGLRFEALLDWLAHNFRSCRLLVGDDLQRLNLMALHGYSYSERQGMLEGRRQGDTFERMAQVQLRRFPDSLFQIVRLREITTTGEFHKWYAQLNQVARHDRAFAASIDSTAKEYINRQQLRGIRFGRSHSDVLLLSKQYLIEEIAVFGALASQGWIVDAYPGPELPTLAEIAEGLYPSIPYPLHQRINIELEIRAVK